MKFFRMDSDLPDWAVWEEIYAEIGPHDYGNVIACYSFLYAEICKDLNYHGQEFVEINLRKLGRSLHISRRKLDRFLTILGEKFNFCWRKVGEKSDKSLTFVELSSNKTLIKIELFYPNLVKKQRPPKRDGSGKFTATEGRQENTRQELENISKSRTKNGDSGKPVYNSPPVAQTRPAESILEAGPDSVPFEVCENKKGEADPPEPKPPTDPVEVREQSEFDNAIGRSLYEFIFAMNAKFSHTPKIAQAKPETWGVHIKRLRIDDGASEKEIKAALSYAIRHNFWKTNLESAAGFRRAFPAIRKQMILQKTKHTFS